jgi:hypothetical protein
LEYLFCISASHIFDFSLVILVIFGTIGMDMIFLFKYPLFYYLIFSSRTTFYVLPFEYFYFIYPNFFCAEMINVVEVSTGLIFSSRLCSDVVFEVLMIIFSLMLLVLIISPALMMLMDMDLVLSSSFMVKMQHVATNA